MAASPTTVTVSPILLNFNLPFNIDNKYNFRTIAPAILQNQYKKALLIGKADYFIANQYANISALQQLIYPLLNGNDETNIYPSNPKAYEYYIFRLPNCLLVALQSAWIIPDSIELCTELSLNIKVDNLQTNQEVSGILSAIASLGYVNINANVVTYIDQTNGLCIAPVINSTFGLFGGGYQESSGGSGIGSTANEETTSIYTYATNTAVTGGNLTYSFYNASAVGNSTVGVFGAYYDFLSEDED